MNIETTNVDPKISRRVNGEIRDALANNLGLAPHEYTIRGGTIEQVWGPEITGAHPELVGAEIRISGVSGWHQLHHNGVTYAIRRTDDRFGRRNITRRRLARLRA